VNGEGEGERPARLLAERRALLIRLNSDEERLRLARGRRREAGRLSAEEMEREIERGRTLSRLGFGQIGGAS
jgi:hypothetical protein